MHWFQQGAAEIGEINWIKSVIALEGIRKNDDDYADGTAIVVSKCAVVHNCGFTVSFENSCLVRVKRAIIQGFADHSEASEKSGDKLL